jgi:5-formyltetrahydrofolate cyclo-ligase
MRALRDGIPEEDRVVLAGRILSRLLDLPAIRAARTVLLFSSFGSEVPTEAMAERLLADGKRVLLPFLSGSVIEAAELRPDRGLVQTRYGPKEPPDRVAVDPLEIDVVVMPGLAFDPTGQRIGYGAGHYDRYLRRLARHVTRVGIGFHVQVVDAVPHGRRDERLDVVVTDRATIVCAPVRMP